MAYLIDLRFILLHETLIVYKIRLSPLPTAQIGFSFGFFFTQGFS